MSDHAAADQVHCAGDNDKCENLENIQDNLLLEGFVLVSGKEKQLKLMHTGLTLGAEGANSRNVKKKDFFLTWQDVICAVKDSKSPANQQHSSFSLHYIHHGASNKLRAETVKIVNKDEQTDKWINTINEECQKVSGRPKKAFVVINPIGGAKRGRDVYQKKVAPLLELAGIHATVTITEKSKHGLELGEHQDFSGYDVIIIVGGDGMYQEVLLGLTLQIQKKTEVDYNNPDSAFTKLDIPFGIIPAGTGNGISGVCNGIIDEVTAALNIIRGEKNRSQIFTVHSCGKFVTLCGVLFGYGETSELMKRADELRWMGRLRYPYTMIGMLVKKTRMFNCNIEYCVADNQNKQVGDCSSDTAGAQGSEWTVHTTSNGPVSGLFSLTSEYIINGKDVIFNPYGKCVDLLVDYGCKRVDLLKTIFTFINGKNATVLPAKLEYISRITGFRIRVIPDVAEKDENVSATGTEMDKILNIDGEAVFVDKPDLDIRVRSDFVSLYGIKIQGGAEVK